jgi:predicted phosphodiesterase
MRAWVMSDLHVDAGPYELPTTPADVDCIIIAGDVADGHHLSARGLK